MLLPAPGKTAATVVVVVSGGVLESDFLAGRGTGRARVRGRGAGAPALSRTSSSAIGARSAGSSVRGLFAGSARGEAGGSRYGRPGVPSFLAALGWVCCVAAVFFCFSLLCLAVSGAAAAVSVAADFV